MFVYVSTLIFYFTELQLAIIFYTQGCTRVNEILLLGMRKTSMHTSHSILSVERFRGFVTMH